MKAEPAQPRGRVSPAALESYLAHTIDQVTMRELAREEEIHPSTILRRIRRVEDARDNRAFDTFLTGLESKRQAGLEVDLDPRFIRIPRNRRPAVPLPPLPCMVGRFQDFVSCHAVGGAQ